MIDSSVMKMRLGRLSGERRLDRQLEGSKRVPVAFGKRTHQINRFDIPIKPQKKIDFRTPSTGTLRMNE